MNLYLNALQFSPVGETISVESRFAQEPLKRWIFRIGNTGTPIPPDDRLRVFEPFFSTRKEGVGLGLAVCKRIVDEHLGAIEVQSESKEGTTFEIQIPLE